MSLADESVNKHLCSMQLYVNIVHFLKLMQVVLKLVPLERWIQHMIGGFKTINLAWVNKVAMNGYTCFFVYENLRRCGDESRVTVGKVSIYSIHIYLYMNFCI